MFKASPVSTPPALGLQMHTATLSFRVGAGETNLGSHQQEIY